MRNYANLYAIRKPIEIAAKMRCVIASFPSFPCSIKHTSTKFAGVAVDARLVNFRRSRFRSGLYLKLQSQSSSWDSKAHEEVDREEERSGREDKLVRDLKVPDQWLVPSKALEESDWLRLALRRWLDDEYCPEPTNDDISNTAARSYYESLLRGETDLGVILLKMARELETISYQDSFHGAFSSANAAVGLIVERLDETVA